jgi:arylsulfatase
MAIAFAIALWPMGPAAAAKKPNILVVWGDDVGRSNISAYTQGVMGYRTPNIDRIAREGIIFTDYYGEQSCTAGRSSFIMGQSVFRTGLSKVGLPGAEIGMRVEDPTIAVLLKDQGYATGQFGKNHLGDRDEMLPTNHGFDQFFGNLYHLNAEEEPENEDYPRDVVMPDGKTFLERFGPRGVIAWRQPTTKPPPPPSISSNGRLKRASPGSSGGVAPACTSALTSAQRYVPRSPRNTPMPMNTPPA